MLNQQTEINWSSSKVNNVLFERLLGKWKGSHQWGENICKTSIYEELEPESIRNSQFNNETTISFLKDWTKDLSRHLTEEDVQTANKPTKKHLAPFVIRKMQLEPRWDSSTHALEWLGLSQMQASGTLTISGGSASGTATLEDRWTSYKVKHKLTIQSHPRYLPKRNESTPSHKDPCLNVSTSLTHSSPKVNGWTAEWMNELYMIQ